MPNWAAILLSISLLLIVLALVVLFVLSKVYAKKIYLHRVWHKLYSIAQNQDFLLLNDVNVQTEDCNIHIPHVLIGDHYVYVVTSRYYEDDLVAENCYDDKWKVKISSKNVSNPVMYNEQRTIMLAKFLGWNESKDVMFVSIVCTNADVEIKAGELEKYSYLCHIKDLNKIIKGLEKNSKCGVFQVESIEKIADRLHRISVQNNDLEKKAENAQ